MEPGRDIRQSETQDLPHRNYELLRDTFDAAFNATPEIEGSRRILGIVTEDGRIVKLLINAAAWEETMANFSLLAQSFKGKIRGLQLTGVLANTEAPSRYNISLDLKPEALAAVSTAVDRLKTERVRNSEESQTSEE
ncbi:MAG: hypothetical protein AAB351_02450 [Patescibacteria group bacterium]